MKPFETPGAQHVGHIAIDAVGQIIAATNVGASDYVMKVDEMFSPVWTKVFSGSGNVRTISVPQASARGSATAG